MPNQVRLAMVSYAVTFSAEQGPNLLRSFASPIFGWGPEPHVPLRDRHRTHAPYTSGDLDAKAEAAKMLSAQPTAGSLPSPQVAETIRGLEVEEAP